MAPFRNKDFPYFDKMLDIMPNMSTRGGHAFSAIHTALPAPLNPTIYLAAPEGDIGDQMTGVKTATNTTTVNKDTSMGPTFASVSAGKRKLSWSIFHPSPPQNPLWSLLKRRSPTHPFQSPCHPDLFLNPPQTHQHFLILQIQSHWLGHQGQVLSLHQLSLFT